MLIAAFAVCCTAGCTGVFARLPGEPLSYGDHGTGLLFSRGSLPPDGDGYAVPSAWRVRNALYTTPQIQEALVRSFALVNRLYPGSVAPLGDIARKGGGAAAGHGSHRSGRDVDVFFYALDGEGRPLPAGEAMLKFNSRGQAVAWSPPFGQKPPKRPIPKATFDVKRSWALVRAWLTDPAVQVQWVFIQKDLAAMVVAQAVREGEPPDLVAKALELLRQPGDSAPHDDHMHVRFYCDPGQRAAGCVDRGPQRWLKKYWKYLPAHPAPMDEPTLLTIDVR
ncbi:MAG: penicillin-insensitive murein endopeptidase [Deltaproteobacteria bacterium]|nr:penicillin-insensitive murein endopeptidase [Deltaproteobacteria bacterium]